MLLIGLTYFLESGDIPICSPIYTVRGHVGIAMYPFSSINREVCVFQYRYEYVLFSSINNISMFHCK